MLSNLSDKEWEELKQKSIYRDWLEQKFLREINVGGIMGTVSPKTLYRGSCSDGEKTIEKRSEFLNGDLETFYDVCVNGKLISSEHFINEAVAMYNRL